ncbi:MAG: hypothetical protein V5B78_05410 [Desulfohalobiaceae bacterium]
MEQKFYWDAKSIAVEESVKDVVEKQVERVLDYTESSHNEMVKPCHNEPASVHLFQYNPLKNEAYGEIQCCCGDDLTRFTVHLDSKEITYY